MACSSSLALSINLSMTPDFAKSRISLLLSLRKGAWRKIDRNPPTWLAAVALVIVQPSTS